MQTEQGDLVQKAKAGEFDVIVHGCNCFCQMGAGIAKTIKQVFPAAYQADLATVAGDQTKLGTYSVAQVKVPGRMLVIVNGYTQYQWLVVVSAIRLSAQAWLGGTGPLLRLSLPKNSAARTMSLYNGLSSRWPQALLPGLP
jgi:O-acetyl-ADP-ribose deacetylase (regulator of RNase III)